MSVKTKTPENPRYFDRVNYADSGSLIVDLLRSDETRAKRFTDFVDQFHDSAGASPDLAAFDGDAFTGCTADGIMVYVCCKKDAASNDAAGYHVVFGSLASGENRAMRVWDVHTPNSARPNDRALELRPPHGAPHAIPPYAQQRLSWQVSEAGVNFFYKDGLENPINVPIVPVETVIAALSPSQIRVVPTELVPVPTEPDGERVA